MARGIRTETSGSASHTVYERSANEIEVSRYAPPYRAKSALACAVLLGAVLLGEPLPRNVFQIATSSPCLRAIASTSAGSSVTSAADFARFARADGRRPVAWKNGRTTPRNASASLPPASSVATNAHARRMSVMPEAGKRRNAKVGLAQLIRMVIMCSTQEYSEVSCINTI